VYHQLQPDMEIIMRALLALPLLLLAAGAVSAEVLSDKQAMKYRKEYDTAHDEARYKLPAVELKWIQPSNKSERCLVSLHLPTQVSEFISRTNLTITT
jgi:hypothetical protein